MTESYSNVSLPFHRTPALFLRRFKAFLEYDLFINFVLLFDRGGRLPFRSVYFLFQLLSFLILFLFVLSRQ